MGKIYLLFILLSITASGQTKIDEFLSVKFPANPVKNDTVVAGMNVLTYFFNDKLSSYSVQRLLIDSIQKDLNSLPSDLESLNKFYSGNEKGFSKSMQANGFKFEKSKEFKVGKFVGKQVIYVNVNTNLNAIESKFIILNQYLYTLTYVNLTKFSNKDKDDFLNSITIDTSKNPQQMLGKSIAYKRGYILGQVIGFGVLICGLILLIRYFKREK